MKSRLANVITTQDPDGLITFNVVLWYNGFDITVTLHPEQAKQILTGLEQLALDKIKESLNESK